MKKTESKIQAESYKWFTNTYCLKHHEPRCLMFSVPNELAGRNARATVFAKTLGLTAGVSDTIVMFPNQVIFLEFKTKTGRQSKKQKEFQYRVESLGQEYYIIRSVEEFKELITSKLV